MNCSTTNSKTVTIALTMWDVSANVSMEKVLLEVENWFKANGRMDA